MPYVWPAINSVFTVNCDPCCHYSISLWLLDCCGQNRTSDVTVRGHTCCPTTRPPYRRWYFGANDVVVSRHARNFTYARSRQTVCLDDWVTFISSSDGVFTITSLVRACPWLMRDNCRLRTVCRTLYSLWWWLVLALSYTRNDSTWMRGKLWHVQVACGNRDVKWNEFFLVDVKYPRLNTKTFLWLSESLLCLSHHLPAKAANHMKSQDFNFFEYLTSYYLYWYFFRCTIQHVACLCVLFQCG